MTEAFDRTLIEQAGRALCAGEAVVYPTETVYGLGVDADSPEAIDRLFVLKGGRRGTGVSLLVTDWSMAEALAAQPVPAGARELAAAFWPGPLTLVVPASARVARDLAGPGGGVGLRCSSDLVASALVRWLGRPVTATSANPTGCDAAASIAAARAYFGGEVACYVDGGVCRPRAVSTVVEFLCDRAYLRRSGEIGRDALAAVVSLES